MAPNPRHDPLMRRVWEEWYKISIIISIVTLIIFFSVYYIISDIILRDSNQTNNTPWIIDLTLSIISNIIPSILLFLLSSLVLKGILDIKEEDQRIQNLSDMKLAVRDIVYNGQETERMGIVGVRNSLDASGYRDMIVRSRKCVRLLTTLMEDALFYEDDVKKAAANGCKFRVLMLDPYSSTAEQRSKELGQYRDYVKLRVESRIRELNALKINYGVDVEIRLYDSMRSMYMCICDDNAIIGFFWHKHRAPMKPMLDIKVSSTPFGQLIDEEFETIWDHAKIPSLS